MNAAAIIPSIGASPLLDPLVRQLADELGCPTLVPCNVADRFVDVAVLTPDTGHTCVVQWDGLGLYAVWNSGMDWARAQGADVALILNDDVTLAPGASAAVVAECRARRDYAIIGYDWLADGRSGLRPVRGTMREYGLGGFAFAVNLHAGVRADERFGWWGGDDDLVFQAWRDGWMVGVLGGALVTHDHPGTSSAARPEVMARIAEDRQLLVDKWGADKAW